jgi:hypothetical protein
MRCGLTFRWKRRATFLYATVLTLCRRTGPSERGRQNLREKVSKQKLVVIGNGMAGIRTVEVLLDRAPDLYDITVLGSRNDGFGRRVNKSGG